MNEIEVFQSVKQNADILFQSNVFSDTKTAAQAFVKVQAGRELGIEPFQAMNSFDIIQGKVAIKPIALAGLAKRSGKYDYRIIESSDTICKIDFYEKTNLIGTEIFTIKDAQLLGLTSRDQWKKQPKNMLTWRCLGAGIRHYCPDIFIGTIYISDEVIDVIDTEQKQKNINTNNILQEQNEPTKSDLSNIEQSELLEWKDTLTNCRNNDELNKYHNKVGNILNDSDVSYKFKEELKKMYNKRYLELNLKNKAV